MPQLFCAALILVILGREGLATKLEKIDQDCDTIPLPSVRQRNKCFTYNGTTANWAAAQSACQSNGGRLAVVDDAENLELAVKLLDIMALAASLRVYVGGRKTGGTGFVWHDGQGTPLPGTSALWNTNEPSEGYTEDFVAINPVARKLHDIGDAPRPYMCEFETKMPMTENEALATDGLRLRCVELKGRQIGSSCFFVNETAMGWEQCFDNLAAVGARPARIYTTDIADNLANLLISGQEYWTGLRKWGATAHWMRDATTADHAFDVRPKPHAEFTVGDNNFCVKLTGSAMSTGYKSDAAVACTTLLKCLGEIVAPHQKFKKISHNQRLTPINTNGTLASLTLSWPDERACAGECMLHDGCLGFNFNLSVGSCELLAFKTDGIPAFGVWNAEIGTSFHERHH